ncbi:uncharacterized protein LOC110728538 [Chenopodium quinoa]|uniref:AT3G52170-like helix-turn-helix domain-containing protein n=1 Tax=Chenopodium quinoa TaxID=63459 RepID=A0A803MIS7_CHEQI|nr:uncharacterized protein LOC110728538 [Chenopodium quinoa]
MYSLKGNWVGQTFAIATSNDSGGKRSRIRRSKEERKIMIESFIKRYQSSNNGNFPSLNLTHKEVGGSFYTVREIVREIIQENRVLGPGQFNYEEQKDDTVVVDYPLGTISSEPQGVLFQTTSVLNGFLSQEKKETMVLNLDNNGQSTRHFDLDVVLYSTEHQTEKIGEEAAKGACISSDKIDNPVISDHQEQENLEEVSLNSNGQCFNVSEMDSDRFVNHVRINETSEEFDKLLAEGSPECENFKAGEESESIGTLETNSILPTEDVQVETFPLRPTTEEANGLRSTSSESGKFDCNLNDLVAEKVKLSNSTLVLDKDISCDSSSDLMTIKGEDNFEVSASGGSHDMIIQHAGINHIVVQHREDNLKIDLIDMPDSVPNKDDTVIHHDRVNRISPHDDSTLKTAEPNNLQPKTASKRTSCLENINETSGKNFKEPTVETGKDSKRDGKPTVGSSPPLDRIDLESWKASKKEDNPLLTIFKAFVDAFVRFWSE